MGILFYGEFVPLNLVTILSLSRVIWLLWRVLSRGILLLTSFSLSTLFNLLFQNLWFLSFVWPNSCESVRGFILVCCAVM